MSKIAEQYTDLDKLRHNCEIDSQFGCVYLQVGNGKIAKTLEQSDLINIDVDKMGKLVGVEFVGPRITRIKEL